jgi:hypothetical protein
MKKLAFLSLFVIVFCDAPAQENFKEIDRLKHELANARPDTTFIITLKTA